MPTLYDNFERVRQYIDQHQADVDLSSYVSKDELSAQSYLTAVPSDYPTYAAISEMGYITSGDVAQMGYVTNEVTQLDGPLFISYQTVNNAQYTLNAYSHIIAGTEDKTGVSLVATKRKCGGDEGTSYMASFFTNSDGRSKFAHKSKISATEVGGQSDDAFMCFNAYGFRIAYSGEQGVAASTEYEILHEGNIGNLGYVSGAEISQMGYITANDISGKADNADLNSYLSITNFTKPVGVDVVQLKKVGLDIHATNGTIYPHYYSTYAQADAITDGTCWLSHGTMKQWVNGRLAEIEASYATTADLPVIDENIIPKESGAYTLGDVDHLYARTYTGTIQSGSGGLIFRVGSSNTVTIGGGDIRPNTDGAQSLGRSSNHWNNGYINNIYTNTAYLQDTSYTKSIVPAENNAYTLGDLDHLYANTYTRRINSTNDGINIFLNNSNRFAFQTTAFKPNVGNVNLGTSSNKWVATYTQNLYADTIHNFIWTGTSAEYAALDNYTSYQIYMIKEA